MIEVKFGIILLVFVLAVAAWYVSREGDEK